SSQDVAGASLSSALNSPIEQRLRRANLPLWHLGKHVGFDPRMYVALNRLIRALRPQMVHTHLSVFRYVLPVLIWRRVPAAVHAVHNSAEHETDTPGRFIHRLAFGGTVVPVAISRDGATGFKRAYGIDCAAVVPNGIPVENYQRGEAHRVLWRKREGFTE